MARLLLVLLITLTSFNSFAAIYSTPGFGVKWTLTDLVTNSAGNVTVASNEFFFTDGVIISINDTLQITTNEIVKFASIALLRVEGVIIINPPSGVLFTAANQAAPFPGVRIETSNGSVVNKLTMEYASSFRVANCSPVLTDCIFRYNNAISTTGSGALALFNASPVVTNCQFIQNNRAAIQGGANIANAPKIINCIFLQNNTMNLNTPQINLGSSGTDTTKIIGCQIIGGNTNSGGIAISPIGNVFTVIKQNLIKNNRYGITLNGGSNITAMISYNRIDDNNIQNDPLLGGSGIAFSGGIAGSHQATIVTGNIFTNNLWGVTIFRQDNTGVPISGSRPNLGNLMNADTSDDGKNHFINNTNALTPGIDLYNNSSDPIFAMGNNWNSSNPTEIENKIFHQPDNPALGLVTYGNATVPVRLLSFVARRVSKDISLQWQTAQENNSSFFSIEKSINGIDFISVGSVNAAGFSSSSISYQYSDIGGAAAYPVLYYRLRVVDKDGSFAFSNVVSIVLADTQGFSILKISPTIIHDLQPVNVEVASSQAQQPLNVIWTDGLGRRLAVSTYMLNAGMNKITLDLANIKATGVLFIQFVTGEYKQTFRVLKD